MPFPEILKELREKKGFTQKQLAEALYLSKTTISQYENGTHIPSIETFIKLADIFDISIDYLLGRTSVPVTFSTLKKSFASEENIDDFLNMLLSLACIHSFVRAVSSCAVYKVTYNLGKVGKANLATLNDGASPLLKIFKKLFRG